MTRALIILAALATILATLLIAGIEAAAIVALFIASLALLPLAIRYAEGERD